MISSSAPRIPHVARTLVALGGILACSVRCGAPADAERLHRFESCDELQLFLEDQILAARANGGPGFGGGFGFACGVAEPTRAVGDAEETANADSGGAERSFTTTNTQEVEVDEPDFVKNDGDHVYVLRRGEMIVVDAWPPVDAAVVSRTPIAGQPFSMLFASFGEDDERVTHALVLSRFFEIKEQTLLKLYDVTDPAAPALLRDVLLDGTLVDARRVDDRVLVVTSALLRVDVALDDGPFTDDANRARLRDAGLGRILPKTEDYIAGVDTSPRVNDAAACKNTYAPATTDGESMLLVAGVSLLDPEAPLTTTGVVSSFANVYGSTKSLYLAATEFSDGGFFTPSFALTRLHKLEAFRASEDGAATYVATGLLQGEIKDELSLDEDEASDTLRVVLTDNADSADFSSENQATSLVVLERGGENDDDLLEVARVEDLGRGEQVESVRFLGERAYVVTYPVVESDFLAFDPVTGAPTAPFHDPLYVVDLAKPKAPKLRGELEVGGYSAYLHPVDEDHVLAVGVNTTEQNEYRGLKLTLFDVSDPDEPREAFEPLLVGDERTTSEALFDRHAFTYFAQPLEGRGDVFAIPLQRVSLNGGASTSQLAVYEVDVAVGVVELGRADQAALFEDEGGIAAAEARACTAVRRSAMIADDVDAYVYAVSNGGVTVSSLDGFADDAPPVAAVSFFDDGESFCDFGSLGL